MPRSTRVPLLLLAVLPVLAHAPALGEGRLLGPGKGAALHYPLRAEVWASYRRGELPSWNPTIFSGAPLLAAYRPGALYPPLLLGSVLSPFAAFQVLVLASLSAAAVLLFLYLRRMGANMLGAYVAGLAFALGPYLVDDLGDTATVLAAPLLPLLLLAAEAHLQRATPARAAGLAAALALLLLAGSPDGVAAGGALLLARLLLGHLSPIGSEGPGPGSTALTLLAGLLLAAPQLLPMLLAAREAGPPATGYQVPADPILPGFTGLVLRYVSHTPAPSLAVAALPLVFTLLPIRALALAVGLTLALQWGRAPLTAPGPLALVFDFTLAVASGLAVSALWEARRGMLGRRLRAYFLVASLASATALSVAAAVLGPLPQTLAGAVGVLAVALILFFTLAEDSDPVKAGLFVLPLTVSFLLQPHGREAWAGAPTRTDLERGTPTREAIDRVMGERRTERVLSLVRQWPTEAASDLAYGNLGGLIGRRNANGYDPFVPLRQLQAFDGMSPGGTLPDAFFRTDPGRLRVLGVTWVQAPADVLACRPDPWGLGESLDLPFDTGRARFFPLPISPATEVRLAITGAESLPEGSALAAMRVRLASGRDVALPVRASRELGGPFGAVPLGGRYSVDGVWLERLAGPGRLTIQRLGLLDGTTGRSTAASLASGYLSDAVYFREAAATPLVRLFEIPGGLGRARVVETLRRVPDEEAVLRTLRLPTFAGFDSRREALVIAADAEGVVVPDGSRGSRAEVVRGQGGRIELRAVGPGVLVVTEGWDPGWTVRVDDAPARRLRLNGIHMGVVLGPGAHRVLLRYRCPGLGAGLALAGLGAAGLALVRRRS